MNRLVCSFVITTDNCVFICIKALFCNPIEFCVKLISGALYAWIHFVHFIQLYLNFPVSLFYRRFFSFSFTFTKTFYADCRWHSQQFTICECKAYIMNVLCVIHLCKVEVIRVHWTIKLINLMIARRWDRAMIDSESSWYLCSRVCGTISWFLRFQRNTFQEIFFILNCIHVRLWRLRCGFLSDWRYLFYRFLYLAAAIL